ncbi:cytochrome P450 [Suillus discolor]|uniref:Cytochrome P450 n=1 Tax=Suillus discolor TaxID=1912936 RepID=A0A9P7EYD7_9AGAM|nr:cytochrome P450 [Suillus discolor]KAG2097968.1 cytochrome P450 [Suillus discolor]
MDKEGANLADRTLSDGLKMVLAGSGERLRLLRRVLHAGLQPKVAETYEPIQTSHAKNLVLDILNDLKNHQGHAMRLSQLKAWHQDDLALFNGQSDAVRRHMREGTARPSFARFILEHQKQYQFEDKELGYIAGGILSAITIMIMATTTHTDEQAHLQEKLDEVVRRMRLPTFNDQKMLPQVTAFMLESFRWRPVNLGGFGHRATKDIIWRDHLIPAGATVIVNHWAIANDPEVFPEPHKFNPQRWIDDAGLVRDDLRFFAFGFGRRLSRSARQESVPLYHLTTALILWAFRLSENPAAKIDTLAFSDTANIYAAPFEICVQKRINENVIRKLKIGRGKLMDLQR